MTGYENAAQNAHGDVALLQRGKTFSISVLTDENFTADISLKSSAFKFNIWRQYYIMCSLRIAMVKRGKKTKANPRT